MGYNCSDMKTAPKLYLPDELIKDAKNLADKAKNRIYLLSMVIDDDKATHQLFEAIYKAANRGVNVDITADTYTYYDAGGLFNFNNLHSSNIRSTSILKKHLKKNGATFHMLGGTTNTQINGRTHSKWLVIDDTVYSFGGINFYKDGIEHTDFMLKIDSKPLADLLCLEQKRIHKADRSGYSHRSRKIGGDKYSILIDGGIIGNSIIYNRACNLAKDAKSIIYVSQYCPTGKLSKLLKKTDSMIYYNPSDKTNAINSLFIRANSYLSGHESLYERDEYIHSKFMIFEMEKGNKVAITGSHNFTRSGVLAGTREVALESCDSHVISQLYNFFNLHIK